MSKKTEPTTTTQSTIENTEERAKVETLVDELLDKVLGGSTLCQHCNQPCGDCVQPPLEA